MLPFRCVYHDAFDLHLGNHVFPSLKYKLIHETMLWNGVAVAEDFVVPQPATDEDMMLVHTPEWVHGLRSGTLTTDDVMRLEIPYSPEMVTGFWLMTGGTILASRLAMTERISVCIGGGFHHGFANHGEGFCAVNDIAVAIRVLQRDRAIHRAMVVDCDVHHGNGTADIFAGDPSVYTISIHQANNYPTTKPRSDIDIHLPDGVGDEEYNERLQAAFIRALQHFSPDLILYVAGADPYENDQLGGLALTLDGLKRRDRVVFQTARHASIPVAVVLAGGYAVRLEDTVAIHTNTILAAADVYCHALLPKSFGGRI